MVRDVLFRAQLGCVRWHRRCHSCTGIVGITRAKIAQEVDIGHVPWVEKAAMGMGLQAACSRNCCACYVIIKSFIMYELSGAELS